MTSPTTTATHGLIRWTARGRRRHRVLAAALVVGLSLTATSAGVLVSHGLEGRRAGIVQRFDTQLDAATGFIEAYVRQIETRETDLAKRALTGTVTPASLTELASMNQLERITLFDGDGELLAQTRPGRRPSMTSGERAGLESALGAIPSVTAVADATDALDGADANVSTIAFAVPFDTPTGPRVFTGRYSGDDTLLRSFVSNALKSYRTGKVYLVTSTGVVIVADRRDDAGQALSRLSPGLARAAATRRHGFFGDQATYFVTRPVDGTTWRLVFTLGSGELFETITPTQRLTPWVMLAGFFVVGLGLIRLFMQALTGRAQAEDARTRQEAILEAAGDAFIGLDDTGRVTDWNTAATRLLGWSHGEVVGRPFLSLGVVPERPDFHWADLERFLRTRAPSLRRSETFTVHHRDGHDIPVELTIATTLWDTNWRVHAFLRDITERLEHEQQLHELALTDPLTGLANRRAFLDQLDQAHARLQRHHTPFAVLYADVDHFKSINDSFGHSAGDAVLRQISERLLACFRTEDTVGRLGGDEFAVIFESSADEIDDIATRLHRILAEPYQHQGQTIMATASIGLAVPHRDESAELLLERADHLMYSAKKGRPG